jgi:hypothetical protein
MVIGGAASLVATEGALRALAPPAAAAAAAAAAVAAAVAMAAAGNVALALVDIAVVVLDAIPAAAFTLGRVRHWRGRLAACF